MGRRKHKDDVCKEMEYMAQFVHKCDCGHSMYLSPAHPKRICRWCGNMVYLDKREEFKERLKNIVKK